jgi:hypothetical protein
MAPSEPVKPAAQVDMSPEAIAARIRRVVELNRLCQSLAAARPAPAQAPGPPPGSEPPGPVGR